MYGLALSKALSDATGRLAMATASQRDQEVLFDGLGTLAAAREAERHDRLGITYADARAEDLGAIPDATVDAAAAVLVLHHVDRPAAALAELARVLRPGGTLALVLPHPWAEHPGARGVVR